MRAVIVSSSMVTSSAPADQSRGHRSEEVADSGGRLEDSQSPPRREPETLDRPRIWRESYPAVCSAH